MILVGAVFVAADLFWHQKVHDIRLAMAVAAMAIFATLRLPAAGMDRSEWFELWILTFAPSLVFGTVFGGVLGMFFFPEVPVGTGGFSGVASIAALISIYVSYYMVGYLSREARQNSFLIKVGTSRGYALKGVLAMLKVQGEHVTADKIIRAHLMADPSGVDVIRSLKAVNEIMKAAAVEEYQATCLGNALG
jgi:hypothetical protein